LASRNLCANDPERAARWNTSAAPELMGIRRPSMNCPFCRKDLDPSQAWKATSGTFYCNEYCAEIDGTDMPLASSVPPAEPRAPTYS